jgi:3-oxoacyl-[acyl-carrier-protein] synthase-3
MKIKAIASALPEWTVDNETIQRWSGLESAFLDQKIGVHERHFLRSHETGMDLSARAVAKLASAQADFDPARIGLLMVVTQNPDYRLPHTSALLQHRLGLPNATACFDISLGCSGFVYALSIAKGLMQSEEIEEALVVTCDPYSKVISQGNRDVVGLFGDAATATWLTPDGAGRIGRVDFGTDGAGGQHLMIRAGGAADPFWHLDGTPGREVASEELSLHMNGRAIFNFMMHRVPVSLQSCLARNGLTAAGIDYFVFHQASRFLLESISRRLALPADKVPIALEKTGNTVSSSIPLVLEKMIDDGTCNDKVVLISGFGVGFSWATNIIAWR